MRDQLPKLVGERRSPGMSGIPAVKFENGLRPSCCVENLRVFTGKHSSSSLVDAALASSGQKVHWAVNGYFRSVFASNDTSRDFRLKTSTKFSSVSVVLPLLLLPVDLLVRSATFLDCASVLRLASVNKHCKHELVDNDAQVALWLALLVSHGYCLKWKPVSNQLLMGEGRICNEDSPSFQFHNEIYYGMNPIGVNSKKLAYFELLKRCYLREMGSYCPECTKGGDEFNPKSGVVVPIVYGYPSERLISLYRSGHLVLGGDYLMEGASNWRCRACQHEYYSYPFQCGILRLS